MILKGESKRLHNAFSETNINEQKFRTRVFRLQSTSELPGGWWFNCSVMSSSL